MKSQRYARSRRILYTGTGTEINKDKHKKIMNINQPIFLTGLPRSGTTWIASVMNTALGIKYFHEPFNSDNHPNLAPPRLQFLQASDRNEQFSDYYRAAFQGKCREPLMLSQLSGIYKKWIGFPGQILIKDVHTYLALDWIDYHINPKIVIIIRHPCAVADSWHRLCWKPENAAFNRIIEQPKLMNFHLKEFEAILLSAKSFWEVMGAFWGACYSVILRQKENHPDWIIVKHEDICKDPENQFKELFDKLNLKWTKKTEKILTNSTTRDSGQAYETQRITSREADKWKRRLQPEEIEKVRQFVKPFELNLYPDF